VLLDTIDISDLCELLHAPELVETKQPNNVAKWQNSDANVGGRGHELVDLCGDTRSFIPNDRTLGDELWEFTFLVNGGRNIVDYIVGSPIIWLAITHFEVIIDDTCYCVMRGDFDYRPLHL
jgi:hypothetical protein